ncbi:MAG: YeeE/YedE family protein [Hyphomicrobiales bacterium]|nr:YeeE/YedE family protein [Hyphomicrobiales bacterium]MDE2018386.1 YeeE/YedE family protein [Hyphomicrobiales bacterium]
MKSFFVALLAGLMFGFGLALSGMTDPNVVQSFLDPFGAWNPSLIFVMAGAVAVTFVGYRLAFRRGAPLLDAKFHMPTETRIDRRLVLGSALFGVGWGLSGYCPGPAVASLGAPSVDLALFALAMIAGLLAEPALRARFVAWRASAPAVAAATRAA